MTTTPTTMIRNQKQSLNNTPKTKTLRLDQQNRKKPILTEKYVAAMVQQLGQTFLARVHDLLANCPANRVDTRADGVIIDEHGACTALPQPAPEPGIVESKSVSKHVKKGALGINTKEVSFAVHLYWNAGNHRLTFLM